MKVIVIGGGVVGFATAHYLNREGHDVEVIERLQGPALQCSHAPTGQIASGHCGAWASPAAPGILLKSLFYGRQALELRMRSLPGLLDWGFRFLRECTRARFDQNSLLKLRLCLHSAKELDAVRAELKLQFDHSKRGILFLHRRKEALERASERLRTWNRHGLHLRTVDLDEMCDLEPSLRPVRDRFAGAIFSPDDESGDAAAFTCALRDVLATRSARLHFEEEVLEFGRTSPRITHVKTNKTTRSADAFVIAAGWESARLCAGLGLRLPIYPVKGCSVTYQLRAPESGPTRGLIDEHFLVGIARLGQRVRFAGRAIFTGPDTTIRAEDFEGIEGVATELYGSFLVRDSKRLWACLRPMTPDGPPILGATNYDNLYLNTGHGHIGWTMACGSAALISQLISGRVPDIDLASFSVHRYRPSVAAA